MGIISCDAVVVGCKYQNNNCKPGTVEFMEPRFSMNYPAVSSCIAIAMKLCTFTCFHRTAPNGHAVGTATTGAAARATGAGATGHSPGRTVERREVEPQRRSALSMAKGWEKNGFGGKPCLLEIFRV
jgi:hypothetical protein